MMTIRLISSRAAASIAVVLMLAVAGCELADKSAPPLSGPSTFALSVTLVATPDRIAQDGASKTTITAFVRDASNQPVKDLPIQWAVFASDGRTFVEPSWRTSPTDANGQTSVDIKAPPAPEALPVQPLSLIVTGTPLGTDNQNQVSRQVVISLTPPLGTQPINNLPVPSFTVSPSTVMIRQTVTVDASQTRDEGVLCNDNCFYGWDFGDGRTDAGRRETHEYASPGTYTITLTVTDARGGIATTTRTVVITEPSPISLGTILVSPVSPVHSGEVINFIANAFTVGTGATIEDYTWSWGDGSESVTTESPQAQHTFVIPAPVPPSITPITRSFVVTVTVRDSLDRTRTASVTVAVTNP
jgi:PKD repeat protein